MGEDMADQSGPRRGAGPGPVWLIGGLGRDRGCLAGWRTKKASQVAAGAAAIKPRKYVKTRSRPGRRVSCGDSTNGPKRAGQARRSAYCRIGSGPMRDNAIVFAGLMPHAPILVPGVGREDIARVRRTVSAMEKVAWHVVAAHPDAVLLISPHSPRRAGAFGLWQVPRLHGSFGQFGSPGDQVDLPLDGAFAERLGLEVGLRGFRTWRITGGDLDHGATVPLSYLMSAGWRGPTVVVSLNNPGEGGLDELGQAIAATARALGRRLALIASGDMSHRLTPAAPNGFHPDASRFDNTFIAMLRRNEPAAIRRIDANLQETAAEDVVDSTRVALAATGYATEGHTVLSYEGPFGVGYGVAILYEPGETAPAAPLALATDEADTLSRLGDLPMVARRAVAAGFGKG